MVSLSTNFNPIYEPSRDLNDDCFIHLGVSCDRWEEGAGDGSRTGQQANTEKAFSRPNRHSHPAWTESGHSGQFVCHSRNSLPRRAPSDREREKRGIECENEEHRDSKKINWLAYNIEWLTDERGEISFCESTQHCIYPDESCIYLSLCFDSQRCI